MYTDAIKFLENAIENYSDRMEESQIRDIMDAEMECRNAILNKNDLRRIVKRVQKHIFGISRDLEDLDELIGY